MEEHENPHCLRTLTYPFNKSVIPTTQRCGERVSLVVEGKVALFRKTFSTGCRQITYNSFMWGHLGGEQHRSPLRFTESGYQGLPEHRVSDDLENLCNQNGCCTILASLSKNPSDGKLIFRKWNCESQSLCKCPKYPTWTCYYAGWGPTNQIIFQVIRRTRP